MLGAAPAGFAKAEVDKDNPDLKAYETAFQMQGIVAGETTPTIEAVELEHAHEIQDLSDLAQYSSSDPRFHFQQGYAPLAVSFLVHVSVDLEHAHEI